jgi:hypothetical protein
MSQRPHSLRSILVSQHRLVSLQGHVSQLLLQARYHTGLLLLLLPCLELIIPTQTSQSLISALETLISSDSCEYSAHGMVVARPSLIWTYDQSTPLRLNPNSITRLISRKSTSQGCCQFIGKSAHYVSDDPKGCSLCTLNWSASLKLQVPTIPLRSITKSRDNDLHYCQSILS